MKLRLVAVLTLTLSACAQTNCGNTLNSANAACQVIGSGSLSSKWTVISRHGEYAQSETECNIPQQVTQSSGSVTITAIASAYTCGNFNLNGTVNTTPSSFPYSTGDIQMSSFNFQYGTVTIVGRMPPFGTGLWPAFWLMGSNCQTSNLYTGDTGVGTCPNPGDTGYIEIDFPECYGGTVGTWCQFHVANPSFGMGGGCDATYSLDANFHTFQYVWTSTSIVVKIDGTTKSTCNTSMSGNMFFIAQIQTGGAGGTPINGNLPASMALQSVEVQDLANNIIFYDNFTNAASPPTVRSGNTVRQ